jgi:SAM-dependent methyltransferase
MSGAYEHDLAYVHDAGFGQLARAAAAVVVDQLRQADRADGLVVDLGCGSGILAAAVVERGFGAYGVDLSPELLQLARNRAPQARFEQGSLWEADIPPCAAVTAIGEALNYDFDERAGHDAIASLFRRVHAALEPGGVFVFDVSGPGRERGPGARRGWTEGADWLVCVEAEADAAAAVLTRRIITMRRSGEGDGWRRSDETHRLRLYDPEWVRDELLAAGFDTRSAQGYGATPLPQGHVAFAATTASA